MSVLLFNSRMKLFYKKIKSKWSCAFRITQIFSYGSIKVADIEKGIFKMNKKRLKPYYGADINAARTHINLTPT